MRNIDEGSSGKWHSWGKNSEKRKFKGKEMLRITLKDAKDMNLASAGGCIVDLQTGSIETFILACNGGYDAKYYTLDAVVIDAGREKEFISFWRDKTKKELSKIKKCR